mmetsp:Transcript_14886/g.28879  ORF Transcript_14886/g.28879 Transcript_14886/m.28879 type:complete len:282 (-) Transcript_14886:996-1841(-)|eukprot:CAMPEP_0171502310 /NCGR_PEP_ID=MMETSP0958-20121227/10096_1 /TAXON_ID=87120 /ORGANISM="Aurantiochytrium limacinum, Strain ATCCMYA-1381" /LENGTH=281 /DNA_ID=CAMNT_0012037329 /DNA_START=698 /DNA_END=1543 /DNA_ORIENTATION=+
MTMVVEEALRRLAPKGLATLSLDTASGPLPEDFGLLGSVPANSQLGVALSVLGPLAAISCFLMPISTVRQIRKKKSTGDLPLLPFLCMAVQSALWLGYGILMLSGPIIVPNLLGLTMGTIYTIIFYVNYIGDTSKLMPQFYIAGAILVSMGVASIILTPEENLALLGLVAASSSVFFAASPLAAIVTVLRTQSTDSMPLQTSFTMFVNGSLWCSYGALVANDPALYIPNFLGGSAGAIQLAVHIYLALLPRGTTKNMFNKQIPKVNKVVNKPAPQAVKSIV